MYAPGRSLLLHDTPESYHRCRRRCRRRRCSAEQDNPRGPKRGTEKTKKGGSFLCHHTYCYRCGRDWDVLCFRLISFGAWKDRYWYLVVPVVCGVYLLALILVRPRTKFEGELERVKTMLGGGYVMLPHRV